MGRSGLSLPSIGWSTGRLCAWSQCACRDLSMCMSAPPVGCSSSTITTSVSLSSRNYSLTPSCCSSSQLWWAWVIGPGPAWPTSGCWSRHTKWEISFSTSYSCRSSPALSLFSPISSFPSHPRSSCSTFAAWSTFCCAEDFPKARYQEQPFACMRWLFSAWAVQKILRQVGHSRDSIVNKGQKHSKYTISVCETHTNTCRWWKDSWACYCGAYDTGSITGERWPASGRKVQKIRKEDDNRGLTLLPFNLSTAQMSPTVPEQAFL